MDPDLSSFITSFARIAQLAEQNRPDRVGRLLTAALEAHLGVAPASLPLIVEAFGAHRLADANIVLDELVAADENSSLIGVSGQQRHHADFSDLLDPNGERGIIGEPDYTSLPVGPGEQQRFLGSGIHLFKIHGSALAVYLRQANPEYGRLQARLEILSADPRAGDLFLVDFREAMRTSSIFRGHVISFKTSDYAESTGGVTFHHRKQMSTEELILPNGIRERIEEQVLGVGQHREFLAAHGAHLKRGVLMYGPPGTGKTHTVRYLSAKATEHTVILLTGNTLPLVSHASEMARALQPAIVVLEDCDLIAEDRSFGHGPQPLLFEVLDAMDGLASDADVTFLLTTNRVESLERALVQRPGRIDLAMEIPRPDFDGRKALINLYGAKLNIAPETVESVAETIEGTTASFTRELVRRAILAAAIAGVVPQDAHLVAAAEELMGDTASFTRSFLGGTESPDFGNDLGGEEDGTYFGWVESGNGSQSTVEYREDPL
ncbi:AAA family ATPase [Arthrobacter sp. MYb224]|uniref:AAA family ATPase n=1 Tax=Micrococcaceae TaxID=1268 RepID=UPI000CFAD8DA|nr:MULTISPECIES: AAA family ATPase [unclassified Arthrobacter]PRA00230.1 AAA family ATPase [Arthrobacter sp. MYb224]PRA04405.1 AAA family ATPase [Arthrobacter sp. MYb229]PRB51681.1 AAA family ATPase [Arthrobacter sp. MYb216]